MKKLKIIKNIALLNIICIVNISCLSNHSKPSQVDISPLENLADYPMYSLEELKERFNKLQNVEGVWDFDNHIWTGDIGRSWVYSFNTPIVNSVYLWIYDNPENAKNYFEKWAKTAHTGLKNRIVNISEDIDVILWHSVMYRNADELYFYNDRRYLYTCIRIGNIIIDLSENFYESESSESGIPTSNNIKMICEVLHDL